MRGAYFTLLMMLLFSLPFVNAGCGKIAADANSGDLVIGNINCDMKSHMREVMAVGQSKGKRLMVFSKIGDSITKSVNFLRDFGSTEAYALDSVNSYMTEIIGFYSSTEVGVQGTAKNSFNWDSLCAAGGWTTSSPFETNPGDANCRLLMEINQVKPGLAIVMYGTNDIYHSLLPPDDPTGTFNIFKSNLNAIIATLEAEGVIPIMSTIPDRFDSSTLEALVPTYNEAIKEIARVHNVPVIDYWLALQSLPDKGINMDPDDLIHPSYFHDGAGYHSCDMTAARLRYGMNMRNKTVIDMLIKVKRIVFENGIPD